MARLPRIILPNNPHHITQRGNRRQQTFYCDDDYLIYLRNLSELTTQNDVAIEAYCLMPNHVHLVLTPPSRNALIETISELHRRYTRYINFKNGWRGHFWQGRFFSVALSEGHFENCISYVENNAVRAKLVKINSDYRWQSHRSQSNQQQDAINNEIRQMTRTGRPRGTEDFLTLVEQITGFNPRPKKPGRKPREGSSNSYM